MSGTKIAEYKHKKAQQFSALKKSSVPPEADRPSLPYFQSPELLPKSERCHTAAKVATEMVEKAGVNVDEVVDCYRGIILLFVFPGIHLPSAAGNRQNEDL